jgi:hypothetical protein
MNTRRELEVAALLIQLEKLAALGSTGRALVAGSRAVKGAIGETTSFLGNAVRGAIGKGIVRTPVGLVAHGAIKASPYLGAGYLANEALGNPVGKQVQLQKARMQARAAQRRAVYDPKTGVMY